MLFLPIFLNFAKSDILESFYSVSNNTISWQLNCQGLLHWSKHSQPKKEKGLAQTLLPRDFSILSDDTLFRIDID